MLALSFILYGLLFASELVEAKRHHRHHHHKSKANKLVHKHKKHRHHAKKPKVVSSAPVAPSATPSPVAPAPSSPAAAAPVNTPAPATPAPAPAANATSSGSGLSSKRGLGLTNAGDSKLYQHASWCYDWNNGEAKDVNPKTMYFPMLWGSKQTGQWMANAQAAIDAGSKYILAFNEPDLGSQANLSPGDAAALYKSQIMPFAGKAKLISPAVTNGASTSPPMGIPWLEAFMAACTGCQIDAFALHIYAGPDMNYWTNYLTQASQKLGKPIWLTEIGLSGASGASDASQIAFLKQLMPWLEQQSFIADTSLSRPYASPVDFDYVTHGSAHSEATLARKSTKRGLR